jgi:hypothetical protein
VDGNVIYSNVADLMRRDSATIKLFPNPGYGLVHLLVHNKQGSQISIRVLDMNGRQLLTRNAGILKSNTEINLDLADFATGLYLLQITEKNKLIFSEKIEKRQAD